MENIKFNKSHLLVVHNFMYILSDFRLFWVITQRVMVIPHRRLGTTYRRDRQVVPKRLHRITVTRCVMTQNISFLMFIFMFTCKELKRLRLWLGWTLTFIERDRCWAVTSSSGSSAVSEGLNDIPPYDSTTWYRAYVEQVGGSFEEYLLCNAWTKALGS